MSVAGLSGATLLAVALAVTPVGWPARVGLPLGQWLGAAQEAVAADAAAGVAATGAAGAGFTALPAVPAGWRELDDRRDECSKRYATDDGQLAARIWAGAVHYRDAEWRWQDISNRLVPDDSGTGLVNEANSFKVWLARRIGRSGAGSAATGDLAAPAVRFSYGSASFALSPDGAADTSAVVAGSSVTYPNVYPGVDLRYEAGNTELKELVVLRRSPSRAVWKFRLAVDHLRLQEDVGESIDESPGASAGVVPAAVSGSSGGRLGLYSTFTGRRLARFGNLIMHDSATNRAGEPAQSSKVGFRVELVDGRPVGVLTADAAWLADPKRVYPVYIDPTITKDAIGDTYISSAYPSNNYDRDYADGYYQLKCGYYSSATGTNHTLIKFSIASLYGVRVTSATLKMYCEHSYYSTVDTAVWCNRATQYWSETGSNWSGRPSSSGLTSDSVRRGNWASFGVSGCVQNWVDKTWGNYGFVVHEGSNGATYWKKFRARENSSGAPYLQVSYAPGVKVTAPNAGFSGEWLTDPQPTFSWEYSSPEPQQKYRVQIGTSSTVWDASTVLADSGDVSSRDATWAPSAPLPDGKLYWRVRGYDGAAWSWWDTGSFRLDANGPVAGIISPAAENTVSGTVTVTAFADDTAAAAASRTSTGTASGTSSAVGLAASGSDSVLLVANGRLVGEDTSPPYSFSWNTNDDLNGHSSLQMEVRDRAGNVSYSPEAVLHVQNELPPIPQASFIRDWVVLGPFDGSTAGESEGARLAVDYLAGARGECNVRPSPGEIVAGTGPSAGRKWMTVSSQASFIDVASALGSQSTSLDRSVVYAAKYIKSETPEGGELWLGSTDGIKVWMNGAPVHTYAGSRTHQADVDKVQVGLEEGWNLLLVKVSNSQGGFGFSAKLCDGEDGKVPGLSYGLKGEFGATLVSDCFNDADGPTRPASWSTWEGAAGLAGGTPGSVRTEGGELCVEAGAPASAATSSTARSGVLNADVLTESDYAYNVDVAYQTSYPGAWDMKLLFRAQDQRNGYVLRLGTRDETTALWLAKLVDGVETQLGSPVPFVPSTEDRAAAVGNGPPWEPHHVRIEARGGEFRVFVDSKSFIRTTESQVSYPRPGRVGVVVGSGNHVHADNIAVEPLAGVRADPVIYGWFRTEQALAPAHAQIVAMSTPEPGEEVQQYGAACEWGDYWLALPPGLYSVYVDANGMARQRQEITVSEGDPPRLVFFGPRKPGGVIGRIRDRFNRPVAGAQVVAEGCNESVGLPCTVEATTDAKGEYLLTDLDAPAKYSIQVDAVGYSATARTDIPVETGTVTSIGLSGAGGSSQLAARSDWILSTMQLAGYRPQELETTVVSATTDVTLGPAGSVSGIVVDEQGNPVPGATVVARAEGGATVGQANTQTDGSYVLEDLDIPMCYEVIAGASDGCLGGSANVDLCLSNRVGPVTIITSAAPAFATGTPSQTSARSFRTHEKMTHFGIMALGNYKGKNTRWLHLLNDPDRLYPGHLYWETIIKGVTDADNGQVPWADHGMAARIDRDHAGYKGATSGYWADRALRKALGYWRQYQADLGPGTKSLHLHHAMYQLGVALHLVQDNRNPHHAGLRKNWPKVSPHWWYEEWVRKNIYIELGQYSQRPLYTFAAAPGHYRPNTAWGWVDRSGHTAYYGRVDGQTYYQWIDHTGEYTYPSYRPWDRTPINGRKTLPLLRSCSRASAGFMYRFFTRGLR